MFTHDRNEVPPDDAITGQVDEHAHLAERHAARPEAKHRKPTDQEWQEFYQHS